MSADAVAVEVSFDPGQVAALERKLGPALFEKAIDQALLDASLVGDAAAKEATPVVTGHARRSTVADVKLHEVQARYPYFNWLNDGKDSRGRVMLSRPSGYQIAAQTRTKVEAELPKILDRAGREIVARWAS